MQIKPKTFKAFPGKIVPGSIEVDLDGENIEFDFVGRAGDKDEKLHFKMDENPKFLTKFLGLYGISKAELYERCDKGQISMSEVNDFINDTIKDKDKAVNILLDDELEPVTIVSLQHTQVPLNEVSEIADNVAKEQGFKHVGVRESGNSYINDYEIGSSSLMSMRVSVFLGRNDASAGINVSGNGNIFACSNQIIPYVHQEISVSESVMVKCKTKHIDLNTGKIEKSMKVQFVKAVKQAKFINGRLEESKNVKMDRAEQLKVVDYIDKLNGLTKEARETVETRLNSEEESLFGLSNAFTNIGTHGVDMADSMKEKLQKLGGQMAILGKDVVPLMKEAVKKVTQK